MNNNATNTAPQANGHALVTMPRYINPMLEMPQVAAMTSQSHDTHVMSHHVMSSALGIVEGREKVVMEQPGVQGVIHSGDQSPIQVAWWGESPRDWATGLFSCFDDWSSCFLGALFPCCLAMAISCNLNECCCTTNCYPVATRTKIRTEYNIVGTICEDAYILCWCYPCALCQMAREIDVSSPENYREEQACSQPAAVDLHQVAHVDLEANC